MIGKTRTDEYQMVEPTIKLNNQGAKFPLLILIQFYDNH